jgi:hypothetical protein
MLTLNPPTNPAETQLQNLSGAIYINALELLPRKERYQHGAIALNVLLVHQSTGEELLIDLLTPEDKFSTVCKIIRLHFPSKQWGIFEYWEVDPTAKTVPLALAA